MALAIIIAASGAITTASAHEGSSKKTKKHAAASKYTCPMHPEVVQNKPGKCPKCGMKLVAMKKSK